MGHLPCRFRSDYGYCWIGSFVATNVFGKTGVLVHVALIHPLALSNPRIHHSKSMISIAVQDSRIKSKLMTVLIQILSPLRTHPGLGYQSVSRRWYIYIYIFIFKYGFALVPHDIKESSKSKFCCYNHWFFPSVYCRFLQMVHAEILNCKTCSF